MEFANMENERFGKKKCYLQLIVCKTYLLFYFLHPLFPILIYTGYRMSYPIVHSPRSLTTWYCIDLYSVQMKCEQQGLWSQDTFQFYNHRPKLHTPNVNQTTQMRQRERESAVLHTLRDAVSETEIRDDR